MQAAEVVGPWAGAAAQQVGTPLAGRTVLIAGEVTLEERGGSGLVLGLETALGMGEALQGEGAGTAWAPARS